MKAVAMTFMASEMQHAADKVNLFAARVKGLRLAFGGQRVLDGLSFELRHGDAVLLRGENGSGKTTLLNLFGGFVRPDAGAIRLYLNGREIDPTHSTPERLARAGLGRLWQDVRLFPTMTALDNVLAATPELLACSSLSGLATWAFDRHQERSARADAMHNLALVGLADRAGSSCDMLSAGQMKRVAIARLLQANASLWLLDEPLAGLDQASSESILELLASLNARFGKTLLIVEHHHERVAAICDRTWFLTGGRLHEGRPK